MESINKIGFIHGKSVLVDKELNIIDGQHRFEACKRLGLPIYYMITTVDPQEAMIELNAQQIGWKMGDYINSWADSGIKCYQTLRDFESTYRFGLTNSVLVLFDKTYDKTNITKIKAGKPFKIDPRAEELAQFIMSCSAVPYYKGSYFIKAISRIYNNLTDKQLEKLQQHIISLPQQATAAAYIVAFENIINRGVQAKNRISLKTT